MSTGPRRFYIETWGCQMNELDSQRLSGQLLRDGLVATDRVEEADVILLNSCSVREKAVQKVYSRLGEYRLLKRHRHDLVIGLCGCVAQQEGERALRRAEELDFVLGPGRVGELSGVVAECETGVRSVATGFSPDASYDIDTVWRDGSYKGMVTIIEGCNQRCTFCIVPTTRGSERCRPMADVVREVRGLLDRGFVEIELLGQTVNHWREPESGVESGADFADLLDRVASLPGIRRLRFVTSYPRDFTPRMVESLSRHAEVISPYLHLPVQSGSDRILRRMGRGYRVEDYLRLVEDLRRARKDLALSTDLIVGFPGEDEDDFAATLELVREVEFASLFAFKYSPRPGTAAPRLPERPAAEEVAGDRLARILDLQTGIQRRLNEACVGSRFEVLVTGPSKRSGYLAGRTPCHRIVHFAPGEPPAAPGSLVDVTVTRANAHSLMGEPAGASRRPARGLPVLQP